jgi:hypothetical protein
MKSTLQGRPNAHHEQLLILELTGRLDPFVDALRGEADIGEVTRHGPRLLVQVDDGQAVLPRIIELAASNGVRIAGLVVSPDALETGGIAAQYIVELMDERGEGELP